MDLARLRGLAADTVRHFDAQVERERKEFEDRVSVAFGVVMEQLEQHVRSTNSVFHTFHTHFPNTVPISVREAVTQRLDAMGIGVEWGDFYGECDDHACIGVALDECSFCSRNFFIDECNWLPARPS